MYYDNNNSLLRHCDYDLRRFTACEYFKTLSLFVICHLQIGKLALSLSVLLFVNKMSFLRKQRGVNFKLFGMFY